MAPDSPPPADPPVPPSPYGTPAAELRELARLLPLLSDIENGYTRRAGGVIDQVEALKFLTRKWAEAELWFRQQDELPPDMPTAIPTEAHFRNEVNRLIRVCLEAAERWEGTEKGRGKRRPATPDGQRRGALYAALRGLRVNRKLTVKGVEKHLTTPDGSDLNEQVQEELRRHPRKPSRSGKPGKPRTMKDVIKAAFKATYPSGSNSRR